MKLSDIVLKNLKQSIGTDDLLLPMYFESPIDVGKPVATLEQQGSIIRDFLLIVSRIARKALIDDEDEELIHLLFSEAPMGLTTEYHKALPSCCWNIPIIFRTDESVSGKIYEIQAPGSGWGDLYLLSKSYKELGIDVPADLLSFPENYTCNIMKATNTTVPKVFHLTDAASVPSSIRYLISITDKIKYWGYSSDVSMHDIDCIISHSVVSTVATNFFVDYLQMAKEGKLLFGISPNLIFDEKAIYLLPFHRKTMHYFSDSVRKLFPYTSLIENNGFYNSDGSFVTIDRFVNLPPRDRKYYLKYGGPDTNRNWGSRSVYRLSGNDCESLLKSAAIKASKGEVWLIQEDESKTIEPGSLSHDLQDLIFNKKLHIKLSSFYGLSNQPMGRKVMGRHHFKVHGQKDTFIGLGI